MLITELCMYLVLTQRHNKSGVGGTFTRSLLRIYKLLCATICEHLKCILKTPTRTKSKKYYKLHNIYLQQFKEIWVFYCNNVLKSKGTRVTWNRARSIFLYSRLLMIKQYHFISKHCYSEQNFRKCRFFIYLFSFLKYYNSCFSRERRVKG